MKRADRSGHIDVIVPAKWAPRSKTGTARGEGTRTSGLQVMESDLIVVILIRGPKLHIRHADAFK